NSKTTGSDFTMDKNTVGDSFISEKLTKKVVYFYSKETVVSNLHFSPICLKTEDEEEKPQLSQRHHAEESAEAEANGGTPEFSDADTDDSNCWQTERKVQSESNSESDSGRNPFSFSEDKASESLQADTDDSVDSDFWKDDRKPQSNLNSLKHETSEAGVKYVTDLKPYSCPQCSKAFRYSSYLKIHMRQHTERYFCSVCGHKSTSSSNLKVHMRTHTGEKPFSCEICSKKYTNKASMQSHMSVHNAERKYSCDVCKKTFAWFTELKYHQCVGESSPQRSYEEDAGINLKRHILYNLNEVSLCNHHTDEEKGNSGEENAPEKKPESPMKIVFPAWKSGSKLYGCIAPILLVMFVAPPMLGWGCEGL
uniref:C2H2-type domain-containing protein n=1 Tax=Oryzias latipes TaxID=8090 RepID=A0A3P9IBI3_ORYLA